jgi:hypothetical protein
MPISAYMKFYTYYYYFELLTDPEPTPECHAYVTSHRSRTALLNALVVATLQVTTGAEEHFCAERKPYAKERNRANGRKGGGEKTSVGKEEKVITQAGQSRRYTGLK